MRFFSQQGEVVCSLTVSDVMKLNPEKAPLYGECVLTVQLGEEECVEDEEEVEFYLLFSGSTQRHLTTTLRLGHVTLQAVCPAHDRDETVRVTLCQARPGGTVDPVAEEQFQFVQDLALDMAHFLVSAAAHRDGLEGALLLTDSHTPVEERERLDETLMLALKHLPLPPGWSVLRPDLNTHSPADFSPHETLLHFAARRGLRRVALFLLQQPGGRDALQRVNKHGHTPARVAQSTGHTQLQHLLSELENLPHLERRAVRRFSPAARVLQHHPQLNTFSLTVEQETDGDPADLRRDVEELRHYAHSRTHTHRHGKAGSRKQLRSVPLILSRDFDGELRPAALTPSEDASLHLRPAACEEAERENGERSERPHGGVLSGDEGDVPADPGNGSVGLEVEGVCVEGVCVEGVCVEERKKPAAVSGVSCGDQQQEEVDSESRAVAQRSAAASETKPRHKLQSGNLQAGTMGQTQGLLPEREERKKASGDLPEEREGEQNSEQEASSSRERTPPSLLHRQTGGEKLSLFHRNVTASKPAKELQIQETGSSGERIHQSAVCAARNPDAGEGSRTDMAPVHNVRLEPSSKAQHDDVTDVSLTAEESSGKIRTDPISLPEMKESSSPGPECDVQPAASPETSKEHSQIPPKSQSGGEELSQEPSDSQIMDATHQVSERSQSPLLVLGPMPEGTPVSGSSSEEAKSGFQSKLEKETQAFQTPPESPSEFFSVDGCNNMASLLLGCPAGSQEIMEKDMKVETGLLEMCESSKQSPVTVLCGSFSKLTIRGSPHNPQLHSKTTKTTERTAEDSETSKTLSSELEETNEKITELETEVVMMCERSGTSEEPTSDPVAEENLAGTAAAPYTGGSETQNDQPPESKDVQQEKMEMEMSTQNPEIPSLPCESLSLTNITNPHAEVETLDKISETSGDTQPELMTLTETILETSPEPIPVVKEHPDFMTSAESNTGTSLDLHHDLIASSEETIEETFPDQLPEVKLFEDEVMISEENIRGTILGPGQDFTFFGKSLEPCAEVSSPEDSLQVHQHKKVRNDLLDLQHELESNEGTHEDHPDLITPSEETTREGYVLNQQPKENSQESVRETSSGLSPDLPVDFEVTVSCSEVRSSKENVLDLQHEATTCENYNDGTSKDSDDILKVTTPHHEVTIGETAPDQKPENPASEESIRYSPAPPQLEETTSEENLRTSLEPPLGVLSANMDSSVQHKTAIQDPLESFSDTSLALENISTSGFLKISEQIVALDVGLDMDSSSAVDKESGLSRDLPSLDSIDATEGGNLEKEKSPTEEERREEPTEKHAAGDDDDDEDNRSKIVREKKEKSHEIQREEDEVLYSLHSEDLEETCSKENAETDVASVCRSVSATSLPGSESVSDGDSLLGPDTTDDTIFRQSEDTLTLTSGISMTGSVSTDDSSITHAVGEPEEEEKKDRLTEVLERSTVLRSASRSHSPSRRHSWEPNKNQSSETDMGRSSVVEDEEKAAGHRRSMSWCPSHVPHSEAEEMNSRSYSLEGLADEGEVKMLNVRQSTHTSVSEREDRGSLASLTEEENENNTGDYCSLNSQRLVQDTGCGFVPPPHTLTKSVSMSAISPRDLDAIGRARPKRRISFSFSVSPRLPKPKPLFAFGSSSSDEEEAGNLPCEPAGYTEYSISEEDPAPLRSDSEVKGTKVSRTFSYLKSKMTKKSKEKDRDRNKDGKEKEKKSSNGHVFSPALTPPPSPCLQCNRPISMKDALTCTNCSVHIHKGCRDTLPMCTKVKMKQQSVTDSAPPAAALARGKPASARERPWSTLLLPEDQTPLPVPPPRKNPTIIPFNSGSLSKSVSISNIAGQSDEAPLKALKILSHSSDSLNKSGKVNESTESLTDEGAELTDSPLMVEFEVEVRELEAESWSFTVDKKYLKQLKKDVIKRQDVIYELLQTELHHVRTLRIMAEVYSKGLQKEVQVELQTLEKMFPLLEELLELHTHFLTHLLERRREEREEQRGNEGGFIIRRIGDVLLHQVTGSNAEKMKKVYGKFCSRHNEAVNIYKELHTRDKRFQAFIKKKMSSAVVRRLSIPECILLVTQRITKYPVLLQRLLQHTREAQEEQDVAEALRQVKEVLVGVDSRVNEYEKRRRLKEVHSRTDSKSIMRMKSGQMFAREDLIRGRKLLHDGPLQLKNAAGRLKDVQALLLSDVFVFLQEKDQKYVFASLDQRSTVIPLQKLIVREVANEERGLFFITAGIEKPEMVEVHASSKDERNTWMQLIQNTTTSIDKDDDEGIPSENEEDKRLQESKAKEMRDQLQKKDEQIVTLLEEKVRLFRELSDSANQGEASLRNRMLFRATGDDVTKGEPIIRDAVREVEALQELVNSSVVGQQVCVEQENSSVCAGSVSLPRRAETFGGFDCHQMNISKNGDREEADDLRRTESDSVLKKGGTANLLLLHKRNSEQFLLSVTRLHDLLNTLQAVVVQQDTFIEEQRQALSSSSLRHPSISSSSSVSSSSSCSSRPSTLMEQEKQRQEEKIREEERRRREEEDRKRREEEEERRRREEQLLLREEKLMAMEEETQRRRQELQNEEQELNIKREELQRELLRHREQQRRLETQLHNTPCVSQPDSEDQRPRSSSTASEDSVRFLSSPDVAEGLEVFSRSDSKRKAKNLNLNLNPFGQKSGANEPHGQIPNRLLQLAKTRDKKEKKKKKGKGGQQSQTSDPVGAAASESSRDKDVFFC